MSNAKKIRYTLEMPDKVLVEFVTANDFDTLQSKHSALLEQVEKLNKDFFLGIIDEWQLNWMNVTGTNEADRSNYYSRAFGVDANMRYSLARMICKALASFEAWKKENLSE